MDRGRSGRKSECLRDPKKQNSLRGAPSGFCFSRKLQFSVCKASSRVGHRSLLLCTHTHGESKLWSQKCSIILQNMKLGREVASGVLQALSVM